MVYHENVSLKKKIKDHKENKLMQLCVILHKEVVTMLYCYFLCQINSKSNRLQIS